MESRPYVKMSLLIIIASMAMLASSNTIQPEMIYDFPTCLEAIKGCFYEIHEFKRNLASGVLPEPGSGFIGPACCTAILDFHEKCWLFILPDPFFTPELQNYCTRQSQMAPPPADPDTPLAPAPAPAPAADPQTPTPAPQLDPPAPAPQAPSPAPLDPPAPAPQAPSPAPVDPPAPAPQAPAPAPHRYRRRCHRHRHGHGGGSLGEKWFCT